LEGISKIEYPIKKMPAPNAKTESDKPVSAWKAFFANQDWPGRGMQEYTSATGMEEVSAISWQ
jgi:hypothetical protein